jgi:NAD(P)-dependent dehydrogenase (short-subunit alcohol dehydrogenase family)
MTMAVAVITGGSRGLGRALARELVSRGWSVVIDGRDETRLATVAGELRDLRPNVSTAVVPIAGDVADAAHRDALVRTAENLGGVDLLVNNASELGPSPLPTLANLPLDAFTRVLDVNVIAPLALVQRALPSIGVRRGRIVNVSSDAAVEAYEGWGAYGSSKAALEQLTNILAAEHPELRVYRVDPGDMRTDMHQAAFPGEDISDRLPPETSVPGLIALIEGELPSGRYEARKVVVP